MPANQTAKLPGKPLPACGLVKPSRSATRQRPDGIASLFSGEGALRRGRWKVSLAPPTPFVPAEVCSFGGRGWNGRARMGLWGCCRQAMANRAVCVLRLAACSRREGREEAEWMDGPPLRAGMLGRGTKCAGGGEGMGSPVVSSWHPGRVRRGAALARPCCSAVQCVASASASTSAKMSGRLASAAAPLQIHPTY